MMNFTNFAKVILLALLGGGLIGCSTADQYSGNKPARTDDRKHAQECVRKAGVTGGYTMTYSYDGQRQSYRVPAKEGVTPAQSSKINACIAKGRVGNAAVSAQNHSSTSTNAQTAVQACRAEYNDSLRRNRSSGVAITGGGLSIVQSLLISVAASTVGQGAGKGVIQNRYKNCMARAGATPSQIAAAVPATSSARSVVRSSTVMTGGTGYRTSAERAGRTTRVAPTKTRTVVRSNKPKDGKLALPTQYPLMKDDAALWPTLTLEQQKRAILFLQSGSSIRSSLEGD